MAESYCLKSCAECGREGCPGCMAGAFTWQCEIVKCCKEKNHESCESCTRASYCPTRTSRIQMPEKVFAMQRREAELVEKHRADAAILAQWVKTLFWCVIVIFGIGLLDFIPALSGKIALVRLLLAAATGWCFFRLKPVDELFGTVAWLEIVVAVFSAMESILQEREAVAFLLSLAGLVCGLFLIKLKCETFRDALSGIDREMSEKWENQWKLYKIGMYILLGCVLLAFIPVLGILAAIAIFVAIGLLIFVAFREYVYLWQTAKTCDFFASR
ncbi:MAG: hypothetical protein IJO05_03180 [Oscillospiraceae bacterium]|nr:hypothetical protein [Oscillospiraceae bacterium]